MKVWTEEGLLSFIDQRIGSHLVGMPPEALIQETDVDSIRMFEILVILEECADTAVPQQDRIYRVGDIYRIYQTMARMV